MSKRVTAVLALAAAAGVAAWWLRPPGPSELPFAKTPAAPKDSPVGKTGEIALPEPDRKFLWETENVAFQIIHKAGPALAAAVADGDRNAVAAFFANDFVGQSLGGPGSTTVRPFASFAAWSSDKDPSDRESASGFADWLATKALEFRSRPQVQVQVIDLAPVKRDVFDGAWKGRWILRLAGEKGARRPVVHKPLAQMPEVFPAPYRVTDGAPLEIVVTGFVSWRKPPIDYLTARGWISGWEVAKVQIASAPKKFFSDATTPMGFHPDRLHDNWKNPKGRAVIVTGGVCACDVDDDGRTDLLISDSGPPQLYMNRGGKFVDEASERGLPPRSPSKQAVLLVDLDNDGDEDLLYGRELYENAGGRFVRRGSLPLHEQASGASAADFDRDGMVDLYISNSAPAPSGDNHARVSWVHDESGPGNNLFRNLGGFKFADVTAAANAAAGTRSCFSTVWMDANDDGWPDAYVINELGNNALLVNRRNGTFEQKHVGPKFDGFAMGVACGDVDGDGRIDVYLGNMKSKVGQRVVGNLPPGCYAADVIDSMKRWVGGNLLLVGKPNGEFAEAPVGADGGGWSYGPVMPDFDGDGRLDLYSTCGFVSRARIEPDG